MKHLDLPNIKYILCPAASPHPRYLETYNQVYLSWWDLWNETLTSLNANQRLYSDSLTRQDYIGCLFDQNQCFALCTFRWVTVNEAGTSNDSYFTNWPKSAIQQLFARGPQVIICGNFCLSPRFRTKAMGFSAKDLLMGLIVKTFLASEADCLSGSVRNNKAMNDVCYRWGATPLAQNQNSGYGDAKVDLIGFFRDSVESAGIPELQVPIERLWSEKSLIPKRPITFNNFENLQKFKPVRAA